MKILIATDGSDFSTAAIEKACELVRLDGAEIMCFSAYEAPLPVTIDPSFISPEYVQNVADVLRQTAEEHVKDAEEQIRKHFSAEQVKVTTVVENGTADRSIVAKAAEWKADVIVVGSHGGGFWGRLLGSVSNGVVHHAPCSVLVVRK
ncbi:MAG: universal stress protein [Pyrinomonadaceae bacterium]